jgi:hypothetical protein
MFEMARDILEGKSAPTMCSLPFEGFNKNIHIVRASPKDADFLKTKL